MLKRTVFLIILSVSYVTFWVAVNVFSPNSLWQGYFSDTYGFIALFGGIFGLLVARSWGYLKSLVGISITLLSLGLLCQFLGQLSYSILFYAYGIENAYPAFGEVFFVLSVPLYIFGSYYIAKAAGFDSSLERVRNRVVASATPVLVLIFSYVFFLRTYDFSSNPLLNTIIEIYYPLGQSFFLSVSLVAFFTTREFLGGIMRKPVLMILLALVFQYLADSMFIYETNHEIWQAGSFSALIFVLSYSLMAFALVNFQTLARTIRSRPVVKNDELD
jgi:hypothetical protein